MPRLDLTDAEKRTVRTVQDALRQAQKAIGQIRDAGTELRDLFARLYQRPTRTDQKCLLCRGCGFVRGQSGSWTECRCSR